MSLPQLLARILIQGTSIVGKAFAEAGRQAVRNAKAVPAEASAAGSSGSSSSSGIDEITRTHRMTLEEAKMILNVKPTEGESVDLFKERLMKSYDHLYKVNAPPAPKGKEGGGSGSFYMQSKVVRARQRIEAEWQKGQPEQSSETTSTTATPNESPSQQQQQQGKDGPSSS
ncbi:unnamed protein product [Sympodiomycopsis kandeliae]